MTACVCGWSYHCMGDRVLHGLRLAVRSAVEKEFLDFTIVRTQCIISGLSFLCIEYKYMGDFNPPPHLFFLSALQDHLKSLAFRQGLRAFSVLLNPDVLQISPSKCFLTSPHSPQLYSRLSSEELLCHVWRLNTIIQVFQQDWILFV